MKLGTVLAAGLVCALCGCSDTGQALPEAPGTWDGGTEAAAADAPAEVADQDSADGSGLAACCPTGDCQASSGRILRCHPAGGLVETYPDNDAADQRLDQVVIELAACPRFKTFLSQILVVVAPPNTLGLEGLPEFGPDYAQAEGAALPLGLASMGGTSTTPTLVVASDSLLRWNLGATHELLHLVHHVTLSAAEKAMIVQAYASVDPNPALCSPPLLPCNEYEFFAYTGQWFLAGYGDLIQKKSLNVSSGKSAIYDLHQAILGDCRVQHGHAGLTESDVEAQIDWVLSIYQPKSSG